jgi:myo-inositol catabolism protein IolC
MAPGYDGRLYILAFDHRGSFEKLVLGPGSGPIGAADAARIRDAKSLIYEGVHRALAAGLPREHAGVLVDEQYGAEVARRARADGAILAMPVERSGQDEFDFEYGDAFGAHVEAFDPAFTKVLVRYNPDGDATVNARQTVRPRRLSDWLHARDRRLLFELLIPPTAAQLASVAGDAGRYDREVRPDLMVRAIAALQGAGVEPDVWKIEGLDRIEDCARVAAQTRAAGRDRVGCVGLGRGADDAQVEAWLRAGAPVPGYVGFAIGRSIFSAAIGSYMAGDLDRAAASDRIAAAYLRFVRVYADAAPAPGLPAIPEPAAARRPGGTRAVATTKG